MTVHLGNYHIGWDVFMQFCSKVMTQHISEAAQFPFHCGQKPSLAPQFLVWWRVTFFCLIVNSSHWRTTSQTLTTYRHKLNVREGTWYQPTKPHTQTRSVSWSGCWAQSTSQVSHHWLCPWVMKKIQFVSKKLWATHNHSRLFLYWPLTSRSFQPFPSTERTSSCGKPRTFAKYDTFGGLQLRQ